MKCLLPVLIVCGFIASISHSEPNPVSFSSKLQLVVYPIANSQTKEHVVIIPGAPHAYRTVEDLKAYMASLKDGSVVEWSTGCIKYTHLPVGTDKISIDALKAYAKSEGVTFNYLFGW